MTVQLANPSKAPRHDAETSRARKSFFAATHLAGQSLLLNIISVPVLAYIIRNLGADGYGQWATAASLVAVASALTGLGLRGVFVRAVARDENSAPAALADQLGIRLLLCVIATMVVIGVCYALRYPPIVIECAAVASVGMFLTVVASTLSDLLQGLHRISVYASANFFAGLILTIASVIVIKLKMGPVALSVAYLCGPLVAAVLLIEHVHRELFPIKAKWHLGRFWQILKDSKFFAAQMVTNSMSINAESLIAPRLIGTAWFGLFSAGMTLASRLVTIPDGISSAFYPVIAQAHAKDPKAASKHVTRALVLSLLVCLPAAIGVTAFAQPVAEMLFSKNAQVCQKVICITIWALPLLGIESVMGYALNAAKKDAAQARYVFISANVSLLLSIILIWKFGIVGACWSYLFRSIVRIAFLAGLFRTTFALKLPILRIGAIVLSSAAMAGAMLLGHRLIGLSQQYTMDAKHWLMLLVSLSLQGGLGMGIYALSLVALRVSTPARLQAAFAAQGAGGVGMKEPLVSVVVPTFNRAHCLARALDSALMQSHRNVEAIVIDDGSTDQTELLIRDKYGSEPRLRYFKQANRGVTAARNLGLAMVRGDFIALLDSDDVWKPWKLATQIDCMNRVPEIGMVWTDMQAIGPNGNVVHKAYLQKMYSCWRRFSKEQLFDRSIPLEKGTLFVGDVFSKMFMGSIVHTSTVLLRRDRFEKVKRFNEDLERSGEDYDFHFRSCRDGLVGFVDLSSIEYQIGMDDALTQNKYKVQIATNTLKTITFAFERDRAKIDLPAKMIRRRFAEVHAWLGEVLLDEGKRSQAKTHLAKSLAYYPWQPRTTRLLALAAVPRGLGDLARSVYRRTKGHKTVQHHAA